MGETTAGRALGAAFRAVAGESWLVVLGTGLALLRGALALPGVAFVVAGSWLAARWVLESGTRPEAALGAVLGLWGSPRFRAIAIGLWLSGVVLFGAFRVAWLAGAAPVLAWRLSGGQGDRPSVSEGAAWRFRQVLPAAVVAWLLDLGGKAMLLASALGAVAVGARVQESTSPGAAAFVSAFALASSAFLAASLSALADVTVARAAMAGEGPVRAFRQALRAFLGRPAAFVAILLVVWVATGLAAGSVQGAVSAFGSMVRGAPRPLLLVPELILAAVAAFLAALAELWRLSAVGALALSRQPGRETRWMSLRSESLGIRPPSQ